MKSIIACGLTVAMVSLVSRVEAQHYHLNAGALVQTQDSPLYFKNGVDFVTNSGFALPLTYVTNGAYAGYYESESLSFTAIGAFVFNPPAPGTQVRLRFVSVSGPPDGSFGVWDVPGFNPDEDPAASLTFSLPVGTTNGTNSILLSQNNGQPGADPFGHIHGRVYSATRPGLYVVTVQAYDASGNGTGGGPIHTPSELLPMYFQAGDTIDSLVRDDTKATLRFAAAAGRSYYLQATTNLSNSSLWQDIGEPISPAESTLQTFTDPNLSAATRFYRLRITTP